MSTNSKLTIVPLKLLNQDVNESSPQPEPIDDTAGVRAAPPGREAPCAVQVRSRYGARDLMLPSHLMLSARMYFTRSYLSNQPGVEHATSLLGAELTHANTNRTIHIGL